MTVYQHLEFPSLPNRPYFFSNFVSTIDGRTVILPSHEYEPLGSPTDFATFLDLRKYADALIHGKRTAATHRTIETIAKPEFLEKRKAQKKPIVLPYYIVTNHPDDSLLPALFNTPMEKPYIVTHNQANISPEITRLAHIVRMGEKMVDLAKLATFLFEKGYRQVLIEGGPTLMSSFFSKDLIDEIFLTIAPKIISGKQNEFLTMTNGDLIPSLKISKWNLLSVKQEQNDLFLRYQKNAIQ